VSKFGDFLHVAETESQVDGGVFVTHDFSFSGISSSVASHHGVVLEKMHVFDSTRRFADGVFQTVSNAFARRSMRSSEWHTPSKTSQWTWP